MLEQNKLWFGIILADSERACQDLQFEILQYYMPKVKNPVFPIFRINRIWKSGNICGFRTGLQRRLIWDTTCQKWKIRFSRFPDQPDPEIRKFLRIPNGLAKTINLRYYIRISGSGFRIRSGASIGSSSDGQDEAVDTATMAVGRLGAKIGLDIISFLYR